MLDHNSEPESSEDSFLGSDDQALSISDMDDQEIMSSLAISDGEPDQECADEQSTDMSHDQIIFEDDSCNSFYGHNNNPIYALAVLKSHVISGGGDDRCFCWDPSADPPAPIYPKAFSKPKFTDSISAVAISHDAELCAAGCLSGQVAVWKVSSNGASLLGLFDGPSDITSLQFHPKGYILMASGEDGTIWLWSLPSGNCLTVLSTDSFAILKASFYPQSGKYVVSSSADGSVRVWDPKSSLPKSKFSTGSAVNTIDLFESTTDCTKFILAGCEDGRVSLLHGVTCALLKEQCDLHENSVEIVAFAKRGENLYALSCCLGGILAIVEVPSLALRNQCVHPFGITTLKVISNETLFVAVTGSTDGKVRVWDILSGSLLRTLMGHQDTILDLSYIASSQQLVSASDDGCCLVFNLNN
ncbi:60S ribosomal subunit assembly or modification protein [Mitosporidium daphniae]